MICVQVVTFYDQQIKGRAKREEAPESAWNVSQPLIVSSLHMPC